MPGLISAMLQTGLTLSSLALTVPAMSHSIKPGVFSSAFHLGCNLKNRLHTIPAPTSRCLSVSNHRSPDSDHTAADNTDSMDVSTLPILKD